jgi:hypothetical protein
LPLQQFVAVLAGNTTGRFTFQAFEQPVVTAMQIVHDTLAAAAWAYVELLFHACPPARDCAVAVFATQ